MTENLTYELNLTPKQWLAMEKLYDDKITFVLFGGGRGGAKSWLGWEWTITMCMRYPGIQMFVARNELKRFMNSTYLTFLKVLKWHNLSEDIWKLNSQHNYITFSNGSRVDILDVAWQPRDPMYERFGSTEYTAGWLEEIGEIKEKAFDMLKSSVGRHLNQEYGIKPKIFMTCNPKKHWAYQLFYKPWKEGTLPEDSCFIQSLYMDNPYTAEEYGKMLDKIRDPVMRARLKDGDWEYVDEKGTLIYYQQILDMFTREPTLTPDMRQYVTCDVARFGRDRAVIMLWLGFHIRKIWYYNKSSTRFLREKIESICSQFHVPYYSSVADDDGVGSGVLDYIPGIKRFINGSAAVKERDEDTQETLRYSYRNLRSQCYYKLAWAINQNKITIDVNGITIPEDDINKVSPYDIKNMIIDELEVVKRKDPEKNETKLQIIPKEEMKEALGGRSPDFADSMMMRFLFELGASAVGEVGIV